MTLLVDVSRPGSRKTSLVTGSLLTVWWRMPSLGPKLPLAFQLWLSPGCLSASSGGGVGPQLASSPLVFTQSFVLWAGQAVPQSFLRECSHSLSLSFFFFYFFLAIPQFLLLSHISSLSLSSGHSGPVPTLCIQPVPPCSAPARCWRMRATGLPRVNFGFFFFFPLPVMLSSKIPKLPTGSLVRGFPGVRKLLPLHDSLPGTGFQP